MARIMKAVDTSEEVVEFEKVRKMVRKEIEKDMVMLLNF